MSGVLQPDRAPRRPCHSPHACRGRARQWNISWMTVADFLRDVLGPDVPVEFRAYDGSRFGPADADDRGRGAFARRAAPDRHRARRARVRARLRRRRHRDRGRHVRGARRCCDRFQDVKVRPAQIVAAVEARSGVAGAAAAPAAARGGPAARRRHSKARDAAAISFHYDVSNDFYRIVLGPSLTYSCAVWTDTTTTLEEAQANKHELVCRKLGLAARHAAARHRVRLGRHGAARGAAPRRARGRRHALATAGRARARARAEDAGLDDLVEIRRCDYRDVDDGPYDAVSSIGMFEHVGLTQLAEYFARCHSLVAPRGRFLNHGISRPAHMPRPPRTVGSRGAASRRDFTERYVFPDGELHEIGAVVSAMQARGLRGAPRREPARALRAHPAPVGAEPRGRTGTMRCARRERARARVWRLYMAAAALGFESDEGRSTRCSPRGRPTAESGLPLRPTVALPSERAWD